MTQAEHREFARLAAIAKEAIRTHERLLKEHTAVYREMMLRQWMEGYTSNDVKALESQLLIVRSHLNLAASQKTGALLDLAMHYLSVELDDPSPQARGPRERNTIG